MLAQVTMDMWEANLNASQRVERAKEKVSQCEYELASMVEISGDRSGHSAAARVQLGFWQANLWRYEHELMKEEAQEQKIAKLEARIAKLEKLLEL